MGDSPEVETAALEARLAAELDIEVAGTELLGDSLNRVVAVSTPEAGRAYTVRRPNDARGDVCINDAATEYRILERLARTAIPAPEPVWRCEDPSVFGGPFLVSTYLDGTTVPLGSDLPRRFRSPAAREQVADRLVDTLATIHGVETAPFEEVCARLSPTDQVDRTADLLDAAVAATGDDPPGLGRVEDWLRANAPSNVESTLVHGDYRPGNVLLGEGTPPAVAGVLDWETAVLGDPLGEIGYLLLRWRDGGDPTPDVDAIAARHPDRESAIDQLRGVNAAGLAPFTARPGSPTRPELVSRYETRTGRAFEHGRFHLTHAAFTLATVWMDFHRRQVAAGTGSDWLPHVEYVVALAELVVDGTFTP